MTGNHFRYMIHQRYDDRIQVDHQDDLWAISYQDRILFQITGNLFAEIGEMDMAFTFYAAIDRILEDTEG
jgi:hypothetical protein